MFFLIFPDRSDAVLRDTISYTLSSNVHGMNGEIDAVGSIVCADANFNNILWVLFRSGDTKEKALFFIRFLSLTGVTVDVSTCKFNGPSA